MFTRTTLRIFFNRFRHDESGAITVDFVVLSAAVVGLGVSGIGLMQDATANLANALSEGVSTPIVAEEEL